MLRWPRRRSAAGRALRPLAARARAVAERYLDQLERHPEPDREGLAWVLKMLEAAVEEEAMPRKRPAPRSIREPRIPSARGQR